MSPAHPQGVVLHPTRHLHLRRGQHPQVNTTQLLVMLNISDENGDQVYFRFFETNLLEKDGSIIYEPSKLRMSEDYIRYYRFAFLRTNTHTSHATYVVKLVL